MPTESSDGFRHWPKLRVRAFINSHPCRAAKMAVLYPLARSKNRQCGSKSVIRLGLMWFRRVTGLYELDCPLVVRRANYASHCPPRPFVLSTLRGWMAPAPCKIPICPWCYGTYVYDTYRRVARATAGRGFVSIGVYRQLVPTPAFGVSDVERACAAAAATCATLRPDGGLWQVTVDPRPSGVVVRQVVVGWAATSILRFQSDWRQAEVAAADEGQLAIRLGNDIRYPVGCMKHSAAEAAEVLGKAFCTRMRLSGVRGAFREKGPVEKGEE